MKPQQLPLIPLTRRHKRISPHGAEVPGLPTSKYKLTHCCGWPAGHVVSLGYQLNDPRAGFTDTDGHPWNEKGLMRCRKCEKALLPADLTFQRA